MGSLGCAVFCALQKWEAHRACALCTLEMGEHHLQPSGPCNVHVQCSCVLLFHCRLERPTASMSCSLKLFQFWKICTRLCRKYVFDAKNSNCKYWTRLNFAFIFDLDLQWGCEGFLLQKLSWLKTHTFVVRTSFHQQGKNVCIKHRGATKPGQHWQINSHGHYHNKGLNGGCVQEQQPCNVVRI